MSINNFIVCLLVNELHQMYRTSLPLVKSSAGEA